MGSQINWSIIKQFSIKNSLNFTFQDVVSEFPEKNPVLLSRTLSDMVTKGMLCKIARDNYHIIPLNEDPQSYVPDGSQISKYIMRDKEYYIGYASALRIHGFTSQYGNIDSEPKVSESGIAKARESKATAPMTSASEVKVRESNAKDTESNEYVVTVEQMNPSVRNIMGIACHFIQHKESRFFGYESMWINHNEQAMVSDLEKTIVDLATKPQYPGGITELGSALLQLKDKTDQNTLFYYFERNANKSAKKRFLFLSDLLGLEWTKDHDRLMEGLGSGFTLMDPTVPDQGSKLSKFRLKINVDPTELKNKVLK